MTNPITRAACRLLVALAMMLGGLGVAGAPVRAAASPPSGGAVRATAAPTDPASAGEGETGDASTPVAPAGDDDTVTWSVRPTPTDAEPDRPNFQYSLEPGITVRDSLRVRNYGTSALQLVVYASDALITATGAMDLLPAAQTPTDVGAWITLEASGTVTVPPQEILDIPFTLTVPGNATPGDHSGGIVTSYLSPADSGGQSVIVDRRLANRVQVRVAGDLTPGLTVTDVSVDYAGTFNPFGTGRATVRYTVTNTGNVRLTAAQTVRIGGRFGLPGREAVLEAMPELLPGSSLSFVAEVPDVWGVLRATATVTLTPTAVRAGDVLDLGELEVTGSASTWAVPWGAVLVIVLLVVVALWVRWSRKSRASQEAKNLQQAIQTAALVQEAVRAALEGRAGQTPPGTAGATPGQRVPSPTANEPTVSVAAVPLVEEHPGERTDDTTADGLP